MRCISPRLAPNWRHATSQPLSEPRAARRRTATEHRALAEARHGGTAAACECTGGPSPGLPPVVQSDSGRRGVLCFRASVSVGGLEEKPSVSDRGSLLLRLALSAAAAFAVAPAGASAALTSSNIDSPADGSLLRYDDASGPTSVHVTGTASPPGSHVDLRCFLATGSRTLGPTSLDITTDATTGDFEADVPPPVGNVCRLRATDANDPPPSDLSSFTGPKIAVSGLKTYSVDTGSNAGKATDYYVASLLFSAGT